MSPCAGLPQQDECLAAPPSLGEFPGCLHDCHDTQGDHDNVEELKSGQTGQPSAAGSSVLHEISKMPCGYDHEPKRKDDESLTYAAHAGTPVSITWTQAAHCVSDNKADDRNRQHAQNTCNPLPQLEAIGVIHTPNTTPESYLHPQVLGHRENILIPAPAEVSQNDLVLGHRRGDFRYRRNRMGGLQRRDDALGAAEQLERL